MVLNNENTWQVLNNENTWTQGGEHHTLRSVVGGLEEEQLGVGRLGRDNMGEMPDIGDRGWRQQTPLPCMYLCNNPTCSAHVPQNLKCNKIYIYLKK